MGEIIRICVVGLVIGLLARFFYPGTVPMSLIMSMLLGLGGSLLGGALPRLFSPGRAGQPFSPAGLGGSVIGAMLLIFIVRNLL